MPLDDENHHEPASDDHNLPVPRPEPLSFLDLSNGQVLAIDHWLKVNEFGLMSLGKSDGMVKAINAVLAMSEVRFCYQIKFGHPVRYLKTYDRIWSTEQKPWADEVAEAVSVDPRAYEYRSAEVPFALTEDAVSMDGEVLATAGQRIGKTLSATEFKPFSLFVQGLYRAGLEREGCNPTGSYPVQLSCEGRKGPGTKYGVLIVSLIKDE